MPKNKVKLILNMCLIAAACIPRGGQLTLTVVGEDEQSHFSLGAKGPNARLASHVPGLIDGQSETGSVDAHGIQAYFTGLVARSCGMSLTIAQDGDEVTLKASAAQAVSASSSASQTAAPQAPAA